MAKKTEKKFDKKYIYCIVAVLLVAVIIAVAALASCEKKEIIGYDPETPQEWLDELEREQNRTDTDFMRTYYLDGIWREQGSGRLYHVYMGHIFAIDSVDYDFDGYHLRGTMVAMQNMLKTEAEELQKSGDNSRKTGDEYQLYLNVDGVENGDATLKIIDAETVKTVLSSGEEFVYKFVEARDNWPEGFR